MKAAVYLLLSMVIVVIVLFVFLFSFDYIKDAISRHKEQLSIDERPLQVVGLTSYDILPHAEINCIEVATPVKLVVIIEDLGFNFYGAEEEIRILPILTMGNISAKGDEIVLGKSKEVTRKNIRAGVEINPSINGKNWDDFVNSLNFVSVTFWLAECTKALAKYDNEHLLQECPESYLGTWDFELIRSISDCSVCFSCMSSNSRNGGICSQIECENISLSVASCYWVAEEYGKCRPCGEIIAMDKADTPYECMMCFDDAYWDEHDETCKAFTKESTCDKYKDKFMCIADENCVWVKKGLFGWGSECAGAPGTDVCSSEDALKNTDKEICDLSKAGNNHNCYKLESGKNKCGPPYDCDSILDCIEFCANFGNVGRVSPLNCRCDNGKCQYKSKSGTWNSTGWEP